MPTYEYRCNACQHRFEKVQRMSDEPRAECPVCGSEATRQLSGGAALLFKGSGFYITDNRSDSYKKAAGSDSGDKSGGDKAESEKTPPAKAGEKPTSTPTPKPESKSSGTKDE